MHFRIATPRNLPGFVELLWEQRAPAPLRWRITPSGRVELLFRLGRPFALRHAVALSSDAPSIHARTFLSGLHTGPLDVICDDFAMFGVRLHPVGVRALFGLPTRELRDDAVAGAEVVRDLARLEDAIAAAPDFESRARLVTEAVQRWVARADDAGFGERLARFVDALPVDASPRAVVEGIGYSRGHTHRLFRDWLGVSVGEHLRLRRFVAASHAVLDPDRALADVTSALGYYDQSQLTREFRRYARLTPGRYRRVATVPGQFELPETSVQDTGSRSP